ncbi:MAG: hypothetical protein FVQ81_07355 [Candidatus Glassbacteria bacterium]|nr:hypothetical protein [Candidatus Glassbacteria bacterium]
MLIGEEIEFRWAATLWGALADHAAVAVILVIIALGLSFGHGSSPLGERINNSAAFQDAVEKAYETGQTIWPYIKF